MNISPVILYVEDDAESRDIMQLTLKEIMGVSQFTIFPESSNFLERAMQLQPQPDIVLLDIHVKPYDGFQMLSLLRSVPAFQKTPIVALTASVMNEEVNRLKNAGFSSVIAKPLDLETFPNLIAQILEGEAVWYVVS